MYLVLAGHPCRLDACNAARLALAASLIAIVCLVSAPAAHATTPYATVASAGPLSDIYVGDELSCQIAYAGDSDFEFYPPDGIPGDCGTFLSVGDTEYGPDFDDHPDSAVPTPPTPFTPVSQSAVSGSGTAADPYQLTTVVEAGSTGLTVTEVDSYVTGQESYRTDLTIANSTSSAVSGILYRAGDCYLQGSDAGYGFVDPATDAPACTESVNDSPPAQIEELVPITSGAHYVETEYAEMWQDVASQADLPNICDCDVDEDNAAAIDWDVTVPAGGSLEVSSETNLSASGALALSASAAADSGSVNIGSSDGYTITISNPNSQAVTLSDITDTLPEGFQYTPGSSTQATTTDPSISGQQLTWSGPFTVAAASALTLHFTVTVPSAAASYYDMAGADSSGYTVTPSGPAAPIAVGAPSTTSSTTTTTTSPPPTTTTSTTTASTTTSATTTSRATSAVPLPPPVLYKDVDVIPISGQVYVKLPGSTASDARAMLSSPLAQTSLSKGQGFIPLSQARQIPVGSLLDTRAGTASLSAASTRRGQLYTAQITAGVFELEQARKQKGLTRLKLMDTRNRKKVCVAAGKHTAHPAAHISSKVLGLLKSTDHGKFETVGDFSSGTVRGTRYSVEDTCAGTLTEVTRGSVIVDYLHRRQTVLVTAGHEFLARASGARSRVTKTPATTADTAARAVISELHAALIPATISLMRMPATGG